MALAILGFGLPFYFGYGNPLPFAKPGYTIWDNVWLTIFPLMFIGLALGWRYEKAGGYLAALSLAAGLLFGLAVERELVVHMLIPLLTGILFIVAGHGRTGSSR